MENDGETSVEITVKTPITEKVTIVIDYEENDNLGLTLSEKLVVQRVQKDTKGDGKLAVGDQILTVNGRQPNNVDHFYQLIRNMQASYPQMTIEVDRRVTKTPVSEKRAAKISLVRHKSYDYFVAHIYRTSGAKVGLVEPNGLCAGIFAVGDFILDVDGIPVVAKDIAKKLITSALKTKYYTSVVVERIKSELSLRMQLSERFHQDPLLGIDTAQIGKRASREHRQRAHHSVPSILRQTPVSNTERSGSVTFTKSTTTMVIKSDVPTSRSLIHVPRKKSRSKRVRDLLWTTIVPRESPYQ
ncbi:hypothetical protein QR680_005036 [Steinernema hermaphroditum]|uniref:PDZ domain-containing protein n=1 Tax=Steinernema hermaphroditum TaxID=289476 RepID=A0AA39HQN2_9BILA|nr:hypothetical protein QR680_005036 [Steinernema hermaphroditum]